MNNNKRRFDDKDTFEYWIFKASRGENLAYCWQQCYRIYHERKLDNPYYEDEPPLKKARNPGGRERLK